jgi:hypothetical protein
MAMHESNPISPSFPLLPSVQFLFFPSVTRTPPIPNGDPRIQSDFPSLPLLPSVQFLFFPSVTPAADTDS